MSVIINDNFSSIIRSKLQNDLNNDLLIEAWFVRIITLRYLESRNIFEVSSYEKDDIINKCKLQNKLFPSLFINNIDILETNYPKSFYSPDIINLLNNYINSLTPIENIIYIQEEFKNHERLNNFTSTNRNSDTSVNKENISTITQIFTPKWVANYMIHSGIGNNDLYSLNSNEVNYKKIKILDPCLGAGHLILEAFNYLLEKYDFKNSNNKLQIINNIYQNQLYGFDIDENVIIFAKFIFLIKAYELEPMFISKSHILPNFKCIKEYNIKSNNKEINNLQKHFKNASMYGSLISVPNYNYDQLLNYELSLDEKEIVEVAKLLNIKYDFVITNPPYMGRKILPKELLQYLNNNFKYGKSELYAAFIERCLKFLNANGTLSMLTLHTWMFIKSFISLRKHIINNYILSSLVHLGKNTFENLNAYNALACAFVISKKDHNEKTTFVKLDNFDDLYIKEREFFNKNNYYKLAQTSFLNYTDSPFVYWLKKEEQLILQNTKKLAQYSEIRQGLATGNNKEYVRYWYEVDPKLISFNSESINAFHKTNKQYVPYNKGGDKTKWYTTSKTVIKFDLNSYNKLLNTGNHLPSRNYYFKEGITWSLFGFNSFNVRYKEKGYVFDVSGSSLFTTTEKEKYILAYLSSNVAFYFLSSLAPTVNFQVGNIASLPFIYNEDYLDEINEKVNQLIYDAKIIDSYDELSWNFKNHLLVSIYDKQKSLLDNLNNVKNYYNNLYQDIIVNEEKINNIFNEIYNININHKSTTIKQIPTNKEIIDDLISYLIGVVFNRYQISTYHNNLDKTKFIKIEDIHQELLVLIKKVFNNNFIIELENMLNVSLFIYIENYFGKKHINKYHNLPIYWYKKIDNNMYIGYYHKLLEIQLDKDLSIKDNYKKYNLEYKIK